MFTSIELFAGAGGLALGLEKAGFKHEALIEIDKYAVSTLKANRPYWNIVEQDIKKVSFKQYRNKIDLLSGGFPCQSFSYAGNRLGFNDIRGTLFFEFARAIKEIIPKMILIENVKGLVGHNKGKTLSTILETIQNLGYYCYPYKILNSLHYKVPQKRNRFILVAVKNTLKSKIGFNYPIPHKKTYTLRDALSSSDIYNSDVAKSLGQFYSKEKQEIFKLIPQGGCWKDLPLDIQKNYMKGSFYLGGGKTGMARKISWDEPSLTILCNPSMKQTDRCHPEEIRPFTIRESARIQTFPDDWEFIGPLNQQYKQIGNAVPVNLAFELGKELYKSLLLNSRNNFQISINHKTINTSPIYLT